MSENFRTKVPSLRPKRRRAGGADRYDTSALFAQKFLAEVPGASLDGIYLATGSNYADALAGAAATSFAPRYRLVRDPKRRAARAPTAI